MISKLDISEKKSLLYCLRYGLYDNFLLFPSLRRFQRSKIYQNWITEGQDIQISNFPRNGNPTNPLFEAEKIIRVSIGNLTKLQ